MEKEKFKAAPPYADRKAPKGYVLVDPDPICPNCHRPMTVVETEESQKRWCINCNTVNLKLL